MQKVDGSTSTMEAVSLPVAMENVTGSTSTIDKINVFNNNFVVKKNKIWHNPFEASM